MHRSLACPADRQSWQITNTIHFGTVQVFLSLLATQHAALQQDFYPVSWQSPPHRVRDDSLGWASFRSKIHTISRQVNLQLPLPLVSASTAACSLGRYRSLSSRNLANLQLVCIGRSRITGYSGENGDPMSVCGA